VTRIGRYVAASPAELERWLTREVGAKKPVHIANPQEDLAEDLKRGSFGGRAKLNENGPSVSSSCSKIQSARGAGATLTIP